MATVPKSLKYQLLGQAVPARSYTTQFYADNGQTFQAGQSCWITIPCGQQGTYMDPDVRLTFEVENTGTDQFTIDGTVSSCISKLEVYSGSNQLVSINEYNVLYSMLYDCQCPASNRATLGKAQGVSGLATYGSTTEKYLAGHNINGGFSNKYSIPLMCGLFHLNDKELPIGSMQTDLRIKVDFEQNANWNIRGNNATVQFKNISITAICRELPDEVDGAIEKGAGGSFKFHSKDYSNYVNTVAADSGSASILIPARLSSLSTILHCFRPTENILNSARRSVGSGRCVANLSQFQYQINGALVPQLAVAVSSYDETYEAHTDVQHSLPHLLHALGLYEGLQDLGVGLTDLEFLQKNDTAEDALDDTDPDTLYTTGLGTNLFAVDMGSFDAAMDSVANFGASTLTSTIMLNLQFSTPTTQSYRLSSFAMYDTLYFIDENGILNVRK